ncbi:MAG: hypothetical protein F6J98_30985 [Moorea sp. SIO4G2]|uniref:hypothetical protein n=1 Tax=unclassified Moorena TaxID=2683338 RepID=UPI0013F8482C|nr:MULTISPECIES: hypothetical protein [unclassified Moorena]NEO12721.1 hypothetical protein [Moorena sp. SIO3E8]NEO64598.1 hypothetical protein [Moorena sp. SIO4G2]NEP99497.1 hypothetical protein [Moorena sp. SIO3F7]
MKKHYILSINPNADYQWEQCTLRDPITAERPDFAGLIAQAVADQTGSYLVAVNIEVEVLEQAAQPQAMKVRVDLPVLPVEAEPSGLVA